MQLKRKRFADYVEIQAKLTGAMRQIGKKKFKNCFPAMKKETHISKGNLFEDDYNN